MIQLRFDKNNFYGNWSVGEGTTFGVFCDVGGKVGKNCKIQSYVFIPQGVIIKNNVFIGPGVIFCNDKKPDINNKNFRPEMTLVKQGVIIGAGSVILPGLIISENAFVGAGSVVTKDVGADMTVCGNPAKEID